MGLRSSGPLRITLIDRELSKFERRGQSSLSLFPHLDPHPFSDL